MDGQAAEASTASESSAPVVSSNGSTSPQKTSKSESYSLSKTDLQELGLESDDSSDDTSEESSFEYGNVSANPKIQDDESDEEDSAVDLRAPKTKDGEAEEAPEDEWLAAIKKDLEIDHEPDQKSQDPLDLKEIEIERFGVKHKIPFNEAMKLIQQGYDYTQKTQTLAEEKRSFSSDMEKKFADFDKERSQFKQQLADKEQVDYFFEFLKSSDPDLYQAIEQKAVSFKHQYTNPFLEKMMSTYEKKLDEVTSKLTNQENQSLKQTYYKELQDLKGMHSQKYAKLGLKIDENKIREEWINTGEPLISIYKKLYADKILSLAQSRGALDKKVKANSNRAPTMGRLRASGNPKPEMNKQIKKMSYNQIADAVARGQIR